MDHRAVVHVGLVAVVAFACLLFPLYEIHVADPLLEGPTVVMETAYTMECFVFRASLPGCVGAPGSVGAPGCVGAQGWNACYDILVDVNTGRCLGNTLVVGSENLETYGAVVDALLVVLMSVEMLVLVLLMMDVYEKRRVVAYNRSVVRKAWHIRRRLSTCKSKLSVY